MLERWLLDEVGGIAFMHSGQKPVQSKHISYGTSSPFGDAIFLISYEIERYP